jgi:hypothetical protein
MSVQNKFLFWRLSASSAIDVMKRASCSLYVYISWLSKSGVLEDERINREQEDNQALVTATVSEA